MLMLFILQFCRGFQVIYLWLTVICLPGCMVKTAEVIVGFCSPISLQDEQLYRNLHEEINHLALKLEKQGKTDGKNISSRRKHINKMYTSTLKLHQYTAWSISNLEINWLLNLRLLPSFVCVGGSRSSLIWKTTMKIFSWHWRCPRSTSRLIIHWLLLTTW